MAQSIARKDISFLTTHYPLPAASVVALRVAVLFAKWSVLHQTRRDLAELDSHLLKDVGLTPDQARRESARKFWQG